MDSLEQLQKKLGSLDELRSIVKTMKFMSAVSIRQYEQAVHALADYYKTIQRGLHVVLKDMELPASQAQRRRDPRRFAAIVFGSDHGLCGRFNEEIAEYLLEYLASTGVDPQRRLLLAVGARIAASMQHSGQAIEETLLVPGSASQITAMVQKVLLKIDAWRTHGGVDSVYLFYNRHCGSEKQYQSTCLKLLPINLRRFHHLEEERWPSRSLPVFSMESKALLSHLLRQYLFVSIFRASAESQASEHASRLAAMQSAERNLDERLEEVTMTFHRARQNVITSELLDVVAGFEAITSGKN